VRLVIGVIVYEDEPALAGSEQIPPESANVIVTVVVVVAVVVAEQCENVLPSVIVGVPSE
jgi:hypothetical protein